MAASSGIFFADDISQPPIGSDKAGLITDDFIATVSTMLATTSSAKFLLGDIICLAIIPPGAILEDYRVYCPAVDSSTGITWDLGDTQVLSGAVTGQTSTTVQTTPALGTTFTLTAAASTSSFAATNGLLMVGNGLLVNYSALSGSTFTGCLASSAGVVIPGGSAIQQCGNTAAYQAIAVIGQSSAAGVLRPDYNLTGTTFATSTVVLNAVPAVYPQAFNTMNPVLGGLPPTFGNVNPFYLTLRAHASVTTTVTTGVFTGYVAYRMQGLRP